MYIECLAIIISTKCLRTLGMRVREMMFTIACSWRENGPVMLKASSGLIRLQCKKILHGNPPGETHNNVIGILYLTKHLPGKKKCITCSVGGELFLNPIRISRWPMTISFLINNNSLSSGLASLPELRR